MQVSLVLPKKAENRAKLIRNHVYREWNRNAYWRALNMLAMYYCMGFRHFNVFDPTSGEVRPTFFNSEDDGLEYFSSTLLYEIQEIVGQMSSLDLMPNVERIGNTMSGMREKGVAQALLDSIADKNQLEQIKKDWGYKAATYGLVGINGSVYDRPVAGLSADLEVVDSEELMPFPSVGKNPSSARGMVRTRFVPLSWLKEIYGSRKINAAVESKKLLRYQIENGDPLDSRIAATDAHNGLGGGGGIRLGDTADRMEVVRVSELWILTPAGTVSEYCVTSGDYEFEYRDYRQASVYPTLSIERFYENGSWYGTSHFFMRYGSQRAAERMLNKLFKNARQLDRYQLTVLPQGDYNEDSAFTDYGEGLRFLKVRPDPLSDNFRPFNIPPPNSGDQPLNAVAAAQAEGERINPIPNLVEQKGRIDSATGLEALEASASKAITNPEQSMIRAFSATWRTLCQQMVTRLVDIPQPFPVKKVTLDLLGVRIDKDDKVSFEDNPLPNISTLDFSVQHNKTSNTPLVKAEAKEALGQGLMSPDEYKMFLLKSNVDVALWMEPHRSIYHRAVRNIITLYGDGETPGQIVATGDTTRPDLEMMVLDTIIYGEAMQQASVEVQNEFMAYKRYLEEAQQFALPPGVPGFEELIAQAQQPPQGQPAVGGPSGGIQLPPL